LLHVVARRRNQERVVLLRVERLDFRTSNTEAFYQGLERSGPKRRENFRMPDYEIE
jgi:hypothetical protein